MIEGDRTLTGTDDAEIRGLNIFASPLPPDIAQSGGMLDVQRYTHRLGQGKFEHLRIF